MLAAFNVKNVNVSMLKIANTKNKCQLNQLPKMQGKN